MATYVDRLIDSWAHGIWVYGDDWPPDWGSDRRQG